MTYPCNLYIPPFPLNSLPRTIRDAVAQAQLVTEAPTALIAGSALAAASLAVQTQFNVERLIGLSGPCSLYIIIIADSGERKSTVDRIFFSAAREFEEIIAQDETANQFQVLYSDVTPAAFIAELSHRSHSACICEDEGSRFFGSNIAHELALLNKTWGGDPTSVNRKHGRFFVRAPRTTISVMAQREIFEKYMDRKGDEARGIGFLARCLVSYPISTQGSRYGINRPSDQTHIRRFKERSLEMLKQQSSLFIPGNAQENIQRTTLTFSNPAQVEWENIYQNVERASGVGGAFCQNRDYASKIAENIARLAGIFHAFEGREGTEIAQEDLKSAAEIVLWYAGEFLRLFTPPGPLDLINMYARTLDSWLIEYAKQSQTIGLTIGKSALLRCGPNSLRNRASLDIAIQRLIETNRASFLPVHMSSNNQVSRKSTLMLVLHDNYYGQIARGQQPYNFAPL